MPVIEMRVAGMTCGHCVHAITQAIQAKDPPAKVQIDLESGLVSAETRLERAELAAIVTAEGYKPA